jgi:hypothetical protein
LVTFNVGTKVLCCIDSRTFCTLATPAAADVCPMLLFTEPSAQ